MMDRRNGSGITRDRHREAELDAATPHPALDDTKPHAESVQHCHLTSCETRKTRHTRSERERERERQKERERERERERETERERERVLTRTTGDRRQVKSYIGR